MLVEINEDELKLKIANAHSGLYYINDPSSEDDGKQAYKWIEQLILYAESLLWIGIHEDC